MQYVSLPLHGFLRPDLPLLDRQRQNGNKELKYLHLL
jgi:hypothetical protein